MASTYIIAEIGTAHSGDITLARELIQAAHESGADCAKFQFVLAREIVHPLSGVIDLPGGPTAIYDRFVDLERDADFFAQLQDVCRQTGIDFLCSVFGIESARIIRSLSPSAIKIASPELNHTALLAEVAGYGLPLIVSTGVSQLSDIEYALSLLPNSEVTLLHCLTSYPAIEEQYNLSVIPTLAAAFGVPVGLSDHTQEPELVPGLAVVLGATIIEKHFTLDRTRGGLDDPIAMDPVMFTQMSATIRRIDRILANDARTGFTRMMDEFASEYGRERVTAIVGDGVKRLADQERPLYNTTRRSLLATRALRAGERVRPGDIAALRAERLPPGLEPRYEELVVGSRLTRDVPDGHGVRWDDLVDRGE